ncbi:unnamed protein product [Rotaria sordida]|uniref:BED-type domain-containing protein n=1 Tax=Rotaria sordida TaxID=392033 RepID=A0A815PCI9_9BILA|nr:unnamed protein product [Rotaria sordida]CAF4058016.1 unnamed protein product [Rotaria sordida]
MVLSRDHNNDQRDESSNEMDYDLTQQIAISNLATDEVITDRVIDDGTLTEDEDENHHLNFSSETINELHQTKRTTTVTRKDVLKYFTRQSDGGFKCNLCTDSNKVFSKTNENSDTNLRSHLGKTHRMIDFLYPSQKNQQPPKPLKNLSTEEKEKLNAAAIEAIVKDALPFDHFRKPGMLKFLSTIKPGYRGPHRKTVRQHLARLYQKQRQLIKQELTSISHISLTADIWKSPARQHFICLTCHFLSSSLENRSIILSFRRFPDKHSGQRLRSFINNELKKMNLENKTRSITTDGGSDIKCATGSAEFGMRIACSAHNLNLVVKKALWLFDKTASKSKSSSTTTASKQNNNNNIDDDYGDYNDYDDYDDYDDLNDYDDYDDYDDLNDYDDYNDETSTIDNIENSYEEDVNKNESNSDDSDEDNFPNDSTIIYTSSDEDFSNDSSEDDCQNKTENEERISLQVDGNNQRQNNEQIITETASNIDILPSMIYNLLKRVRTLITFIRKSSVLDRYVRRQIQLKNIQIKRRAEEQRIKWNTTYIMISRFVAISSIITDITLSPNSETGLKKQQYHKFQKLSFSRLDWLYLSALKSVLFPFYRATILLSGSKYPTLPLAYHVLKGLKNFLTKLKDDQPLENSLKKLLLIQFNYYFEQEIPMKQKRATLVCVTI